MNCILDWKFEIMDNIGLDKAKLCTPLLLATLLGRPFVVKTLIVNKADVAVT